MQAPLNGCYNARFPLQEARGLQRGFANPSLKASNVWRVLAFGAHTISVTGRKNWRFLKKPMANKNAGGQAIRSGGSNMKKLFVAAALLALCAVGPTRAAQSKTEVQGRLESAAATLRDLAATPDKGIPDEVYKGA